MRQPNPTDLIKLMLFLLIYYLTGTSGEVQNIKIQPVQETDDEICKRVALKPTFKLLDAMGFTPEPGNAALVVKCKEGGMNNVNLGGNLNIESGVVAITVFNPRLHEKRLKDAYALHNHKPKGKKQKQVLANFSSREVLGVAAQYLAHEVLHSIQFGPIRDQQNMGYAMERAAILLWPYSVGKPSYMWTALKKYYQGKCLTTEEQS